MSITLPPLPRPGPLGLIQYAGVDMLQYAAAVSAAKDAEIAGLRAELLKSLADNKGLRAEVAGLRELLEVAQQGLLWYQDTYPNVVNDCDREVMAQIAAALAARKGEA